jgi:hypothetical protein
MTAGGITLNVMKFALAAIVIVATIWCYPLAAEDTGDPCGALAAQALRLETKVSVDTDVSAPVVLIQSIGDFVLSETVQQRYPSMPPGIVCTGYYWRLIADPSAVGTIKTSGDTD